MRDELLILGNGTAFISGKVDSKLKISELKLGSRLEGSESKPVGAELKRDECVDDVVTIQLLTEESLDNLLGLLLELKHRSQDNWR